MLQVVVTHLQKLHELPYASISLNGLQEFLRDTEGIEDNCVYYTCNGKLIGSSEIIDHGVIYAIPRLVGGKGGFGSMLRAIGAQIEKTTNREACRDLSGRRLRDINEEKRLKNWIAQQADREREAAEKRKRKLERLCAEPKHEFKDKEYDQQRLELSEKIWDAVDQGMKASTSECSTSTISIKRKLPDSNTKKKKTCLWVDDIDDISSSPDSDDSEAESDPKKKVMKKESNGNGERNQERSQDNKETVKTENELESPRSDDNTSKKIDDSKGPSSDNEAKIVVDNEVICETKNGLNSSHPGEVSSQQNNKEDSKDSLPDVVANTAT